MEASSASHCAAAEAMYSVERDGFLGQKRNQEHFQTGHDGCFAKQTGVVESAQLMLKTLFNLGNHDINSQETTVRCGRRCDTNTENILRKIT